MTQMKNTNPTTTPTAAPVFVPKDETKVEVTLDDALTLIKQLKAQKAKVEAQEANLIEVAKQMMEAKGLRTYTNPVGIKATFYSSQNSKVDKAKAKEICGARWCEVESFSTSEGFKVS